MEAPITKVGFFGIALAGVGFGIHTGSFAAGLGVVGALVALTAWIELASAEIAKALKP